MITTLIAVVAVLLLTAPPAAEAQPQAQVVRIGLIASGSPATSAASVNAFRHRLQELGYVGGRSIAVQVRNAGDNPRGYAA